MKFAGLILGPVLFVLCLLYADLPGLSPIAKYTLAITLWVAVWWITEPIPIPVTSLLPLILFPLFDVMNVKMVTLAFGNEMIFLYMGGFVIALAIEKTGLHRRMALNILHITGTKKSRLLLGFMISSAVMSMWISNTATALLMLPIGLSIIRHFPEKSENFGKVLMFSIAYSCSIGGIATLVGTPTNLILSGVLEQLYQVKISFYDWMIIGMPVSITLLFILYLYLVILSRDSKTKAQQLEISSLEKLNPISKDEKKVLIVFLSVVFLWIVNGFLIKPFIPTISDMAIALSGAVALFLIPSSKDDKQMIMDWPSAEKLPWGILLLFGGGLVIAEAFKVSGLAAWIGGGLSGLDHSSLLLVLVIVVLLINFMTELTSNVATAAMILPILGSMALSMDIHPFLLMVGAVMAASCAFMLPVATPPNAVVFSSGMFTIRDMVRLGFILNILSVIVISVFVYYLLPFIWDFDPRSFPESFK